MTSRCLTCHRLCSGSYCRAHQPQRGNNPRRGSGWAWGRKREAVLANGARCPCGAVATEVDHVRELADGGTDDVANLQGLCHACHSKKTGANAKRRRANGNV